MRFVVHVPALNGDDTVLTLVDRLVDRFAEGLHRVEVPDADLLQESNWFQQAGQTRRKVLTSSLAKPPRILRIGRGPYVKTVELTDAESARLACRLAYAPLVILVEDREADGVLLDVLVEELGWPELRTLWERGRKATPRAAEIHTAGGKDAIPVRVSRIVTDAADEDRPHRLFVLCDSDARWPGDEERRRPLAAVRQVCAEHGVPHHIWQKRAAENYIPDQAFEAVRDDPRNQAKAKCFDAFLRRSREQRDHFPVKDGLRAEEREKALAAGLYDEAEKEDLELLEQRLFDKRPRPLLRLCQERRDSFSADGLRARDGNGELDTLLRAIAQEL